MRYELVIFDWDGTLMDSIARIVSSMQAAALDVGWGALEAAAVRNIVGLGLPEAIAELCPRITAGQAEALKERYAWYFVTGSEADMSWYPGVEQGLAQLAATPGMRLAVATGKSRKGLNRAFSEHSIEPLFAASRTADETRSKPNPQMLEELLVELEVPVERAVMVGDTEYDMAMAAALGMDGIAVSYGVHSRERLQACRPVVMADDFQAVMDALLSRGS
ncbi:hydrolase [Halomonas cupida]|uniref:Hydrolase n=1 Tax=Halomonas cupida TaxID=44933 RepID=A0A1M7A3U6_9GAMM|nr:HAD-IA family hydrolase [Halomonas cupida]GEN22543.1 hydrolase [Halomonas cupida]SHL37421.1 phosphoglycolate phosphatase [Halomonas cupida]